MNGPELIELVKKFSPFTDVYHVTTFKCYRDLKTGATQEAVVEIQTGGRPYAEVRYSCVARADNGKGASGNPMPNIEAALANVHWWDLDQAAWILASLAAGFLRQRSISRICPCRDLNVA